MTGVCCTDTSCHPSAENGSAIGVGTAAGVGSVSVSN